MNVDLNYPDGNAEYEYAKQRAKEVIVDFLEDRGVTIEPLVLCSMKLLGDELIPWLRGESR